MKHTARYSILKFQPYPNRSEHLNYGMVVFLPQGGVRVHIGSGLKKIKSMYPLAEIESLRNQEESIVSIVGASPMDEAVSILHVMRVIDHKDTSKFGTFQYLDEVEYMSHIELALNSQVEPAAKRYVAREQKSRLFIDVRARFKALGIMAQSKDELPDHQVVEHYSPDPEADIKVEFALQNGILRIAQTIDLRGDEMAISSDHRKTAYSKAFALDYAEKVLVQSSLESYVIVAGTHTTAAKRVMNSLEKTVTHVLSWESNSDKEMFFSEWAKASGKPLPTLPMQ